jgi:hypothetical protein
VVVDGGFLGSTAMFSRATGGEMPFDIGSAGDERHIGQINDSEGEVEFGLLQVSLLAKCAAGSETIPFDFWAL